MLASPEILVPLAVVAVAVVVIATLLVMMIEAHVIVILIITNRTKVENENKYDKKNDAHTRRALQHALRSI